MEDVHKCFGRAEHRVQANDGVSMEVMAGQVVGLLGHNGAGKSTLVNQVVGLLRPDSGAIHLCGVDAVADPAAARALTSVQAQANVPISGLTPLRAIELVGRIRGLAAPASRSRARDLVAALDLEEWARVRAEKVSGGVARLTAFAMCAVVPGRLVILDEPTNDVDPVRRRLLWEQIRVLADRGAAVLVVTHNVTEAEGVVDRVLVLDRGRVIASGTPAALVQDHDGAFVLEVDAAAGRELVWPDGLHPRRRDAVRTLLPVPAPRSAECVAWAAHELEAGRIQRYALSPTSLEDVYISLVGQRAEVAA